MKGWQEEAEKLWQDGKSWTQIVDALKPDFPQTMSETKIRQKIRDYVRSTDQYKEIHGHEKSKGSIEYRADGSIISEKFIFLRDGEELTPKIILEAHGLKPEKWEVVSYKNNFWNTQIKGGAKQISYQSKLTAKPKVKGLDLEEIDKHFKQLDRKPINVKPFVKRKGNLMAEVNIADLHLGKLCWHGNTPENFDYKIAKEVWYKIIGEVCGELDGKALDYITFVWANDFFNADTIDNTTTAGTQQEVDVRWQKMYNIGTDLLIYAIEALKTINGGMQIKTFYTPSNHDEVNGYHALKHLEAWFRNDELVEVNVDAYPRKYMLYGNTLLGFAHGHKENSKGNKERASRLASLMPLEAPELWAKSRMREFHVGHLHSEQAINEINGVIVRRISSPTASDTWHTESGFLGAIRKAQTFIYDENRGLVQIINFPV